MGNPGRGTVLGISQLREVLQEVTSGWLLGAGWVTGAGTGAGGTAG